ncbi:uncharacterized protein LOC131022897 [Salvia miltiorrhiza]|uniref:uncharacterized protein LOC131022897 n=1 Tax=Salvia miltiorrhiza TaxID=226208 RepID=UPI0025ABCCC9|nr:uncharacterized protein LOC131022897 [Salvia miltiorrhiza]
MRNTRAHSHNAENSNTNNEAEAGQPHPTNGGDFMGQFLSALQGFVQQQTQTQATQRDLNQTSNTIDQAVERFRNYNPPRFNGRDGPLAAEEWLEELERIFTHINCTEEQKVSCAIFQLKEDARQWWKHFYRLLAEEDRNVLNWKIFKDVVMDKYFPLSFREKKETEFFELKQGNMTIEEYERKFNELGRFAPHLVDTEDKMIARFRKGLRTDIKGIMAAHVIEDFSDLVKRAEEVATALGSNIPAQKPANQPMKRKWENYNQGGGNFQDKRPKFGGGVSTGTTGTKPQCQKCGKYHYGECMWGKGVCFFCREPVHTTHNCPKKMNNALEGKKNVGPDRRGVKEPEKKGNARFFALADQEAAEDEDTMTGTLLISGTPAVVLFDSGASHSFIYAKFCQKNHIPSEVENLALNISVPS